MRISRAVFLIFLVLTLAAGLYDLSPLLTDGQMRLHSLGEIWFTLSKSTLNLTQAVIQRHLWPPLWDPGLTAVLLQPAAAIFGGLAALAGVFALRNR